MIELKNVYKTYQMGKVQVQALNGVSVSIEPGEFVAIMGPSGSGKSTLMHVLGLLDRPDSGEYFLAGKNATKLSDEQWAVIRNRSLGFIFQQFHLLARVSALENVRLPLVYAGKRHLREKANEMIQLVGLAERANHTPSELSGGQQQRVAIARALINDPFIIFADEPTGNLDSKNKEEILAILKQLNQSGKTIVMVTHEPEIAQYAKRIILMRDGKIVSDKKISQDSPVKQGKQPVIELSLSRFRGWIKYLEYFHQAWNAMIGHKVRALLSILGILIGVAAVIAMLALGQGAKESIEKQLSSLGSNLLMIRGGSSKLHGVAEAAGTITRFTFQDVAAIKAMNDKVLRVAPSVSGKGQLVYGNKNWSTQVEGTGVDYADMRDAVPIAGRFFTEQEIVQRDKVAVIGATIVRELFGEANPIGENIKINAINFKVIGVLPVKGANSFRDQDDTVIIPVTTAMYRLLGKDYIDAITVEAVSPDILDQTQEEIQNIIILKHRLTKDQQDSFEIRNMADIKKTLETTTKTMSMLLGAIAAISLLVGGIGIMNIMLVSVAERTKEIGLRKAIGANNHDVMNQFLIEAILLSFLGGLFGVGLGMLIAFLITVFAGWTAVILPYSVILAVGFSVAVGVIFGIWPAKQASKLNPIEALRYE